MLLFNKTIWQALQPLNTFDISNDVLPSSKKSDQKHHHFSLSILLMRCLRKKFWIILSSLLINLLIWFIRHSLSLLEKLIWWDHFWKNIFKNPFNDLGVLGIWGEKSFRKLTSCNFLKFSLTGHTFWLRFSLKWKYKRLQLIFG